MAVEKGACVASLAVAVETRDQVLIKGPQLEWREV